MRILKPLDWQEVSCTDIDVIVEDVPEGEFDCVVWPGLAFFAQPAGGPPILVREEMRMAAPGIGHARLSNLSSWGSCVIGIVTRQDGAMVCASGVVLGSGPMRSWLRNRLPLTAEQTRAGLRAPVPIVSCALSHIQAAVQHDVGTADSLDDLLDPTAASPAVSVFQLLEPDTLDARKVLDDCRAMAPSQARSDHLLAQSPYQASAPYLALLRDSLVILPGGVVLPEGGQIWSDSTHAAFWLDPNFSQYRTLFRLKDGIGLLPDRELTERDLATANDVGELPGIPLLAFGNAWRNHGHWMMNTVFAAYLLRDAIMQGRVCVLIPQDSDYTAATLRAVGVPRRAMLVAAPGTYRLQRALFPSTLSIDANTFPPRAMAAMFRHIADQVDAQAAPGAELVYVTRIGSPTQRWMTNEDALIAALIARGFVCIAPHELTFEEEVRCFSRARVIVGQLGAGMLNVGFAPPGCRVVEIASHNYALNDTWFLCTVLGHRFSRLIVDGGRDEELTVVSFTFEVPLAPALALIDDVLARLHTGGGNPGDTGPGEDA